MTEPFWRQIILSFFSGSFYQEVIHQPLKRSLRYLVVLILIVSLVLSVRYAIAVSRGLKELEAWAWKNLPEIWIEKGETRSPVPQPWRYDMDRFVFIVDTTGKIQDVPSEFPQGLLLTRHELILKRQPFDIQRQDLSAIQFFHLDAALISKLRQKGIWFFWPLLLGGFFGYFLIAKYCQIVLFSGISLVTSIVSGRALSYRALLNIGVYAMTLPFLSGAVFLFFGPPSPLFALFFTAMYGALLVTAVLHCVSPRETAPEQTNL